MSQISEKSWRAEKKPLVVLIWPQLRSMIGGMFGGIAKCLVGHPFDTLKVRMQTEGFSGRFKGSLHTLKRTVTEEGILAVYKGASLPMVGWSIMDTFLCYVMFKYYIHF